MNKLIVIVGPTASGKTDLSIRLAKKYHGEIISADSRQAYKGLDIGSGKVTHKEMRGVPHYLLDVSSPKRKFTVAHFQKQAFKAIIDIQKRGKIPFLVGGTGFYIQSIVDNFQLPTVKPDLTLRKKLDKKSAEELFLILKKLDPERSKNIDQHNPRRLIRAIEIAQHGENVALVKRPPGFDILQIGIKKEPDELKLAIEKRLLKRLKQGMVKEVENLHREGVSWKRLEELGLEYRYIAQYLQKKITSEVMVEKLKTEIWHFAKRQMTWFRRDERIHWITSLAEAQSLVEKFLQ